MRKHRMIVSLLAAGLILACNYPSLTPAPPTDTPTSTASADTATPQPPTLTPAPLETATATLVPTPSVPEVIAGSLGVYCRLGPDTTWVQTGSVGRDQTAEITGRNNDSSWWYVKDPNNPGNFCWVSAAVVTTAGNLTGLPVIPPPTASVTGVSVDAKVTSTVYCGGPNPVDFSGTITTNGPAKVKYQWEVGGDASNTTPPDTMNFTGADTKNVSGPGAYSTDCGNYTITLHVLDPNDKSAKKNFKIAP